jgi:hypothetical protein
MTFPTPVPEIPAADVDKAAAYYVNTLGFTFDWGTTKAALQASRGGITDCLSPIAPSESPTATSVLPWKLREFMAADLDGNLIRVFYDFRNDMY